MYIDTQFTIGKNNNFLHYSKLHVVSYSCCTMQWEWLCQTWGQTTSNAELHPTIHMIQVECLLLLDSCLIFSYIIININCHCSHNCQFSAYWVSGQYELDEISRNLWYQLLQGCAYILRMYQYIISTAIFSVSRDSAIHTLCHSGIVIIGTRDFQGHFKIYTTMHSTVLVLCAL